MMNIIFKTSKLQKIMNSQEKSIREYGSLRAGLLGRRLDTLKGADNLEAIRHLPQMRCHELTKNLKGQLSVDLDHPYRLLFTVANDPIPKRPDGGLDWREVTAICVIGIEDTHE